MILDAVRVTAVVVAHDGGAYLSSTLAALADQTRPVDAVLGVDTGSRDDSAELLRSALGPDHVAVVRAPGGFGGAVAQGLEQLGDDQPADWLWLLHDDSAPAPDALAALLEAVEAAPKVAVAGCKQLDAEAPGRLIDVGLSVSRWGERLTLIDAEEQDQGQYDHRDDVFAVNSAGMLVRRDVWDHLHGFDPALPATGDDVDFCWRARLAGHRVVVVPGARVLHASRPDAAGTHFAARRAEVYSRLKHAPWWTLPFHVLGALLGGLWQCALGIVVKEPAHGAAKLGASLAALASARRLAAGRRALARTRTVSRSVVMVPPLVTPRAEIWAHRRAFLESVAEPDAVVGDGTGVAEGPSEPTGDSQHDFVALAVASRGWAGTGAVAAAGLALAAGLVALAPLLGAAAAVGGGLVPVSSTLSAIFGHATAWWVALGAGQAGHGDPFDLVLWLLGLFGLGDANRAVAGALVLASPVAALGAWVFAANLTARRVPRFLAALVYAAAPSLITALAQGRLGSVIAHAALPWAAVGMLRAVGAARIRGALAHHEPRPGSGGVPSWTAAAAGGLALACAAAGAPSLVPLTAAVVLVLTLALRRRAKTLWWMLVPSIALFLPLWVSAPRALRAWIGDPGMPLPADPASPWQLVLGQPVAFDPAGGLTAAPFLPAGVPWSLIAAILVGAPVLVAAVAGAVLLTGRRGAAARLLLLLGIGGLAYAWTVSRVPTAVAGDTLAAPFAGPSLAAAGLALLAAAVLAVDRLLELRRAADLRAGVVGNRRLAAMRTAGAALGLAAAVAAAGPAGVLVQWAATGLTHPQASGGLGPALLVGPGRESILPATASDLGLGAQQTRTLVLRATDGGGFSASVMRGSGTTLDSLSAVAAASRIEGEPGAEQVAADDAARVAVRRAVATVGGGAAVDPRADLEQLGVGFVVLVDTSAADQLTASQIDGVPSLVAVGHTDAGWLWRVTPRAAGTGASFAIDQRVRIVDAAGATLAPVPSSSQSVSADIPAGPEGRRLVLAERTDPGWEATLDGARLAPTSQDWAQSFELPPGGGHLDVHYTNAAALPLGALTIAALVVTALMAIPATARPTGRGGSRSRAGAAFLAPEAQRRDMQGKKVPRRASRRKPVREGAPEGDAEPSVVVPRAGETGGGETGAGEVRADESSTTGRGDVAAHEAEPGDGAATPPEGSEHRKGGTGRRAARRWRSRADGPETPRPEDTPARANGEEPAHDDAHV
ncbi:glycosyltransferase family 2 protein [Sinomonas cellulolyticus]|uniref:glycosyltransferase family 2 protein n=1 Tax=Sinomonas cellulolyticus TaxID=2801916 RepID=UPI00278BDFFE|nr:MULTISPECIES: glycosyltransferase family 2 protein [Sinomonas]